MSSPHEALLALLADGAPHPVEELAMQLDLGRDALPGLVHELRERGVAVDHQEVALSTALAHQIDQPDDLVK